MPRKRSEAMDQEDMLKTMWQGVGMVMVLAAVAMLVIFVLAQKKVDGYYLSHGSSPASAATCVYAHWTWHMDEMAFCTDDYQKALDFVAKGNAATK